MNENALQMLREKELKKGADVVTADGVFLGKAVRLYHRVDEIDPELKLYAAYLGISNLKMGNQIFIPVDFIADYDPQNAQVTLTVSKSAAMSETWDREPTFIAGRRDTVENLPL
jgi:hypothetical protein